MEKKIVIAPQAFKGCASAQVIGSTIAAGIHRALPRAQLVIAPIADGGDDTLEILLAAKSGEKHYSQITGSLNEPKSVLWGSINAFPKTAIIELARICGLASLEENKRNPLVTTTFGVGTLICIALEMGYRRLFIGLGGSATNDAGVGLAQALGVRFFDAKGKKLSQGGGSLINLRHIDTSNLNPLIQEAEIIVGCDVNTPIIGENGASRVFGPQKGASQAMVEQLEAGLTNFSNIIKQKFGKDISHLPYLGAAGGTPASFQLFCHAKIVSGAQWILNEIGFSKILENADLVITGEGCMDFQTTSQKAPLFVAQEAKKRGIPTIAIVGCMGQGADLNKEKGIDAIFAVSKNNRIPPNALELLEKASEQAVIDFLAL